MSPLSLHSSPNSTRNLSEHTLFQENSFLRLLGHVELDFPEAPEKAARPPTPPVDPYSRYGPKAEINHIFRVPEKRPAQELSLAFLGLILLPFIGFLVGVSLIKILTIKRYKCTCSVVRLYLFKRMRWRLESEKKEKLKEKMGCG